MGFKAFLVAVDREACAMYKAALDKYLPPEYSEVVYSQGNQDTQAMRTHYHSDDEEKEIRKKFADKNEQPKDPDCDPKAIDRFRRANPLLHLPR